MANPIPAAYHGKDKHGHKTGVQTVSNPGGELCIRLPAKNHAIPSEKNQPVTVALSKVNPQKDPQFLDNVIAELNYKNCTDKGKDTDIWPCGCCFKLPTNLKPGNVVMQWRWKLNSNEFYTSCADIDIEAPSINAPTLGIPSKTTSTFHTPPSGSSASQVPTSASQTITSASQAPTSASRTITSASQTITSASQTITSASQTPSSASSAPSASPTSTSASPITTSV